MCFLFNLYLPPFPLFPFAFVVLINSFVLMHTVNAQLLRTSGLIGKKTSTVLSSVWIFFPDRQYFCVMCQH